MVAEISDDKLDEVAGGITSDELEALAIPLFEKGLTAFDVYTELVNNGYMDEDEQIWDSDKSMAMYLNDMMDRYMDRYRD